MPTKMKIDPGWQLKAEGSRLRLDIYDVIGDGFFGGISAKSVRDAIKEHDDIEAIDVHINSPGGAAFDGITIYNVLAQHDAEVTVHIDGMAASAASVIAMAGDEIRMAENAMMMIHNAMGLTMGNVETHQKMIEMLSKIDSQIVKTYANRTAGDEAIIRQQMADETWFTADEAFDAGFADTVIEAKRAAASFDPSFLNNFKHAPTDVAELFHNRENHGDQDMADMTPEAFAEKHPDAVTNWQSEAVQSARAEFDEEKTNAIKEAQTKAADEATKDERDRVTALVKTFGKHPKFLAEQISKGHGVAKAKAEAFDAQLGMDEGHDGLALDGEARIDGEGDEPDEKTKKHIAAAKKIENEYARSAYCQSVGLDPALVTAN